MSVTLQGSSGARYIFDGPYESTDSLEDRAGVYAILCLRRDEFSLLDIGESHQVRTRVENHDRKECWDSNCLGILKYAVYYVEYGKKPSRMEVERDIAANYYLICGG
jgi:hypothetical protein